VTEHAFKLLNMSSAKRSDSESDLTARARIRDAAIECFGQHGFDVTVRAIAEQAGVSPGLVIHHFGSKDGLRRTCDDHVLGLINDLKKETITSHDSQTLLHQLASMEEYAPYVAYLFRSVQAGGGFAVSFYERMVTDIERYLAAGEPRARSVRAATRPSAPATWRPTPSGRCSCGSPCTRPGRRPTSPASCASGPRSTPSRPWSSTPRAS
jgi:AcrR family transcriptional regulator